MNVMPKWLLYSLLTALCFGVWGVLGKALERHSPFQTQAFSTLGILPIMAAIAVSLDWRGAASNRRGSLYAFLAGLLVAVGNIAYYHALALGGEASTASAFTALYPLTSVVLGFLVLGEKLRWVQVAGIVGSLGAMYLMGVNPGEPVSAWVGYALAPIGLWGGASVVMKVATRHVSAEQATFWFLGAFVPLAAVILAANWLESLDRPIQWDLPAGDWTNVVLLGACYGVGNVFLLAAYRNEGKVSIVTPLTGLYTIVTIPLAILLLKEPVAGREWQWAGIALALLSTVALSLEPNQGVAR